MNSDPEVVTQTTLRPIATFDSMRTVALVTYILFAASAITGGLTALAGAMVAYLKRSAAGETIYESHFTWLIRTFWIGLALLLIGVITASIGVGFLVLVASSIWMLYRIVKGLLAFTDRKPIANPRGFF